MITKEEFERKLGYGYYEYLSGGEINNPILWASRTKELSEEFKNEALQAVGLFEHPKALKAFEMATRIWQMDRFEIYQKLEEYAELLVGKQNDC